MKRLLALILSLAAPTAAQTTGPRLGEGDVTLSDSAFARASRFGFEYTMRRSAPAPRLRRQYRQRGSWYCTARRFGAPSSYAPQFADELYGPASRRHYAYVILRRKSATAARRAERGPQGCASRPTIMTTWSSAALMLERSASADCSPAPADGHVDGLHAPSCLGRDHTRFRHERRFAERPDGDESTVTTEMCAGWRSRAIRSDPAWSGGDYTAQPPAGPAHRGLASAGRRHGAALPTRQYPDRGSARLYRRGSTGHRDARRQRT